MPIPTSEEVKQIVIEWMKGRDIVLLPEGTPKEIVPKGTIFQVNGRTNTGIGISIINPINLPKYIVATTKLGLHPQHKKGLNDLKPEEREAFIWDLKKDLIFIPASFSIQSTDQDVEAIQFIKEVAFDEISDGKLSEAMDNVCRPLIWTSWKLDRKFGDMEESQSE